MPEIDESELPKQLRDKYDHARAAVSKKNLDYAILLMKDLLKQAPGFVEGRIVLREAQRKKRVEAVCSARLWARPSAVRQ